MGVSRVLLAAVGAAVASLAAGTAFPQSGPVKLHCDGKIEFDQSNKELRDVPIYGVYVEVSEKTVYTVGFVQDGTYTIAKSNPGFITLSQMDDRQNMETLNRLSGKLTLTRWSPDGKHVLRLFNADCKPARPLF